MAEMAKRTEKVAGEEEGTEAVERADVDVAMSLKERRQRAFLSTRELAEKASVAPDTIWRIEGGDYKRLRPSTMRKIAAALDVHPSEIAEFTLKPENNGQRPE